MKEQIDKNIASCFMLDPDVTYLNHGSFGACPEPIFNSLIKWQKKLEREPVKHLAFDVYDYLEESRAALGAYINCDKDDLAFFPNPSTALNTVLRSLKLEKGDEILSTDHEYGAMDRAWSFLSKKKGIRYIKQKVNLPIQSKESFIKNFVKGVSEKTKVIFLSQITSSTALVFPVQEVCDFARENNIITIIDGAHVPGQIKLDIKKMNPDFYSGACHKWMCSPKGVAFLYVNKKLQNTIEPLVISWGYEAEKPSKSQFLDYLQWQGTNDMSAYLTIPDTIDFLKTNNWNAVSDKCQSLNHWAKEEIIKELGVKEVSSNAFTAKQMSSFFLKLSDDPVKDQLEFYRKYKIQVPFISWNNQTLFRISIQIYNTKQDIYKLIQALKDYI
jgi:isopenicillin-N epimerase